MHAGARQGQERVGEVERGKGLKLLSGGGRRSATYQSHSLHSLPSYYYWCHTSFPSHLDKTESNDSLSEHKRTDWKRSLPASPNSDRSVLVCHSATPLPSQSVQSTLHHCCYQPIETRAPDPASVSIVSSPHRLLLQAGNRVGGHGWEGSSRFGCGEAISWDSPELQGICTAGQDA